VPIITPFLESFDKVPIQKCGSRNRSGCEKVCRTSAVAEAEAEVCCNTNDYVNNMSQKMKGAKTQITNSLKS
jgi:hypothetical protein